jgi:4-amino-4-deoxy-L-arabinose transferase-like glycosyltransferase
LLVAVSLSWAIAVDLTPADQRPYVGSSQSNSVLELALGYNGLQRLLGRGSSGEFNLQSILSTLSSEESSGGAAGGVGGVSENGVKGVLRLINQQLGGQIGWILPLAVVGLFAALWQVRPRRMRFWRFVSNPAGSGPLRRRRASIVIWGTWFATMAVFFSYAGFYHRYYLTMLAPGVAALTGLGVAALWRAWTLRSWRGLLGLALPLVLVGTALVQRDILADYPTWSARLTTPILALSAAAAVALTATWFLRRRAGRWAINLARITVVAGISSLLIAPAFWSGISVQAASAGMSSNLPAAGPSGSSNVGGPGGATPQMRGGTGTTGQGRNAAAGAQARQPNAANGAIPTGGQATTNGGGASGQVSGQMVRWLIANQGDADYILAVSNSQQASSIIIETGLPVMATGGFSGSDPILTEASLAQLVADGTVRYFLVGGGGPGGGASNRGGTSSFSVTSWVQQNCTAVSATAWGGTGTSQLYACGTAR